MMDLMRFVATFSCYVTVMVFTINAVTLYHWFCSLTYQLTCSWSYFYVSIIPELQSIKLVLKRVAIEST